MPHLANAAQFGVQGVSTEYMQAPAAQVPQAVHGDYVQPQMVGDSGYGASYGVPGQVYMPQAYAQMPSEAYHMQQGIPVSRPTPAGTSHLAAGTAR